MLIIINSEVTKNKNQYKQNYKSLFKIYKKEKLIIK